MSMAATWPAFAPAVGVAQTDIQPFKIRIADEELSDLKRRLSTVRWPPDTTGESWSMGTDLAYMKQLVAYWRDTYNWRTQEAALNGFDQHIATINGQKIHF